MFHTPKQKFIPRDYQQRAIASIDEYFAECNGNPVVVMPTGTGKSLVIAGYIQQVFGYYPQARILILTHSKELIGQDIDKLKAMWALAPAGIYSAGLGEKQTNLPIIFGGIQSVVNNLDAFGYRDLILVDECDLIPPDGEGSYLTVIEHFKKSNPLLKVIGFTATPYRQGLGLITEGKIFTDICIDMTTHQWFAWFIANGYLSRPIPQKTRVQIDVDGVRVQNGEFNLTELQKASDRYEITLAACQETIHYGAMRRSWLTFCSGIEHAEHTAEILNKLGIETLPVHSKITKKQRDERIAAWKAGELRNISNNGVLTVGVDNPMLDLILCLRATQSARLWTQMVGRGMRPCPDTGKQNCLILDFAANTQRLGTIDAPRIPKKKGEGNGEIPIKLCESCGAYNHISARFCCQCGNEFELKVKIEKRVYTDELLKSETPIVETFTIDKVIYTRNLNRKTGNETVKVAYYSGLQTFFEFVSFNAVKKEKDFAGHKAREWWRQRSKLDIPDSVDLALEKINECVTPKQMRVWCNKKPYPEIQGFMF
jgi:DNA repair protein RadD